MKDNCNGVHFGVIEKCSGKLKFIFRCQTFNNCSNNPFDSIFKKLPPQQILSRISIKNKINMGSISPSSNMYFQAT